MRTRIVLVLIAALGCFLLAAGAASAQSAQSNVTVTYPAVFAVSPPLSQIGQPALPTVSPTAHPIMPLGPRSPAGGRALATSVHDQALQNVPGEPLELDDDGWRARFPGTGANGSAPSDANLAVGPNHIVQIVNTAIAVYNKNGTIFPGYPITIASLFSPLGGSCAGQWGDPIVQYDKAADRWLISQLGSFNFPYAECIAVSQTNDPTGSYNLYIYSNFGNNFNDYPKFGVWPTATNSAYTATYNLFANGATFFGAELCAYDRAAMLSGAANPAEVCFTNNDGGYLPSDLDGSTTPPDGTPAYFLNFETLNSLRLYQLAPNFTNPGSSTLSAPMDIAVASFSEACGGGTCIPQGGTSQQLDSLGDRLMYRLAYRNFGDHDALVVNHSVAAGSSVGVRWYELRSALNGAFTVFQQGTFAPDSNYRWMGSAAMDSAGDIAIGYSASSSNLHPAIRYTGRTPTDALGTMRAESSLLAGTGSQTGGLSRWGDYSALRIDPSDDCTFWYTNQYLPNNGSFNWATFIGSFKFSNCGTATPDFSVSASPASQTVVQGNGTSYTATVSPSGGFTGNVTLSASGFPTGAGATFSPNPVTGGSGSSTVNVTTTASTPAGTYTLTITGTSTSPSLTHSTTVTLVVNAAPTPDFSISATPSSRTITQGNSTSYTATVSPSGGFTGSVSLSVSGLPSGASAPFSPNPVTGGSGTSTTNVTTTVSTPAGSYTVTITGTSTSPSLTHSTTVTLVVNAAPPPDFSISATPSSRTITQGNSTSYTATVSPSGGFTGSVSLSVSGLPSGASAPFSPNPVTGGSGTSTTNVTTTVSTPAGSYTVTITGTSGNLTHSTMITLVVNPAATPNFSISASPSSRTITQGNSTSYTATVSPSNGFTSNVTLSSSGLPSGASATFSPNPATGGSGSSTMNVTTTVSTPAGSYTLTITGTSGSLTHSTAVTLVLNPAATPNFSISASPSPQTVTAGNPTSYTATVTPSGGFTGDVTLSASGFPTGAGATFSSNPVTGGSGSSAMNVTTTASTPAGSYTLIITGTSGSLIHSATVTLVVTAAGSGDFSISTSPSSRTVTAGNGTSYTATVSPSGSFIGNVSLSVSGIPSGASATFNPNPITGGSGNSTISVTTRSGTPTGSYTLTITGTSTTPGLTHSTTVTLVVNSFSISASPSSQTVTRGNSTTYTATIAAINGFNGTVTFRVRGLPSNSSASFNPSSVTGQGTSTLAVSTNSSTSTGTFSLRIRGTSGGVTQSTTVQLVVQ